MKFNAKFFSGLGLGLVLSFLFLNANLLMSQSGTEQQGAGEPTTDNAPVNGKMVATTTADTLIADFTTGFIEANNLPANTTIGGFVGRSNLKSVVDGGMGDLVKFRFYLTQDDGGANQIGLIFYPDAGAASVLQTGSKSFCPSMCDY